MPTSLPDMGSEIPYKKTGVRGSPKPRKTFKIHTDHGHVFGEGRMVTISLEENGLKSTDDLVGRFIVLEEIERKVVRASPFGGEDLAVLTISPATI